MRLNLLSLPLLLVVVLSCGPHAPPPAAPPVAAAATAESIPTLAELALPGDAQVMAEARAVLPVLLALSPGLAAEAGLLRDAEQVPSYAAETVAARLAALDAAAARLAAVDVAALPVADRIDLRLLVAAVAQGQQALRVERRWRHRPAEWLEPVASMLLAHTAAPVGVPGAVDRIAAQIPAMLDEARREVVAPTARDVETAAGLLESIGQMIAGAATAGAERDAAVAALAAYRQELLALEGLPEQQMIGAEAYAWRLKHGLLLAWDAAELLARAEADLAAVDAEIAALQARVPEAAPPTAEEQARAATLDQAGVLALYDQMVAEDLAALRTMDVLTVPADLPPLRARPTPEALIPLTGDGGSMSPVPLFGPSEGAWWNVEHFQDGPLEGKLDTVVTMRRHTQTWFGPYAVHEGVPGHHLQLAIARGQPRPLRRLLQSTPSVEGWALYAEELFEQHGGFGGSDVGRLVMLRSYRARIKRVVFDVKVETGQWTLQQAADWKHGAAPGEGRIDPELLRTVQWPTQLICYYAGKAEIVALREELRQVWGPRFSERAFHDALLAEGPIPVSLAREALLAGGPPPL